MTFAEKLKTKRNEHGMSQRELSDQLGVSLRTLTGWEADGRYPKKREIYYCLSDIFNCDVNYFLTEGQHQDAAPLDSAKETMQQAKELFAGNKLSLEEKIQFLSDIQELFVKGNYSSNRKCHDE